MLLIVLDVFVDFLLTDAKWLRIPQLLHFLPQAGHLDDRSLDPGSP